MANSSTMGTRRTVADMTDQSGRVVVVTGANSGIGYETALAFAQKGATVVLACRDTTKGDVAAARIRNAGTIGEAKASALDLSNLASVEAFASRFAEEHEGLDILVNNAGVMMPPFSKTSDGFELQIGTNHLGHFALTARLLPKMAGRTGARIVTVASIAHRGGRIDIDDLSWERRPYKRWAAYGQSKLANLLFAYELHRKLDAANSTVLSVASHPGWTSTNLQQHMGIARLFNPLLAMPPAQGALPSLYAATSDHARGGDYIGPDGMMEWTGYPKKVSSRPASHDVDMAGRLWAKSEALVGLELTV